MPFGIHKHSNRSKQALNDLALGSSESSASSPVEFTSSTDEAKSTPPQPFTHQQQQQRDIPLYAGPQGPGLEVNRGSYQKSGEFPARSQSTRYHSYPQQQSLAQGNSSVDDLAVDSRTRPPQQQTQRPQAPSPVVEKKSKSLFERMRSSNRAPEPKPSASTPPQSSYNNTSGLARRVSLLFSIPISILSKCLTICETL
jgi:hypothetical protein